MYHGILNVYKEPGFTSFDVVAKLRGILGQKKIGHTGTLDPAAEGVLPVCLGKGTKVCDLLTDRDKTYRAVMLLGVETDTQDMTGQILAVGETDGVTEGMLRKVISDFVGEIDQIPPMYSALKIDGKKLCDLARKGQTVERKSRRITIYEIRLDAIELPRVTMTVRCSRGTYIRTLCHDIGEQLGCHASLEHLLRTEASGYRIEDSLRLEEIEALRDAGQLAGRIQSVEDVFQSYPAVRTVERADRLLYNGNPLSREQVQSDGSLSVMKLLISDKNSISHESLSLNENLNSNASNNRFRVYDSAGRFIAVYQYCAETALFRPVKMFL